MYRPMTAPIPSPMSGATIHAETIVNISASLSEPVASPRPTIEKSVELANQQGVIESTPSVDDLFIDTIDKVGHVDNPNAFE